MLPLGYNFAVRLVVGIFSLLGVFMRGGVSLRRVRVGNGFMVLPIFLAFALATNEDMFVLEFDFGVKLGDRSLVLE